VALKEGDVIKLEVGDKWKATVNITDKNRGYAITHAGKYHMSAVYSIPNFGSKLFGKYDIWSGQIRSNTIEIQIIE